MRSNSVLNAHDVSCTQPFAIRFFFFCIKPKEIRLFLGKNNNVPQQFRDDEKTHTQTINQITSDTCTRHQHTLIGRINRFVARKLNKQTTEFAFLLNECVCAFRIQRFVIRNMNIE